MTLTEFLLARIAEDERLVDRHRLEVGRKWIAYEDADDSSARVVTYPPEPDVWVVAEVRNLPDAEHVAAFHPARVLAECEAKRRIVEEHRPDVDQKFCGCCWLGDLGTWEPHPCPTLRALALPYADHPDYDESWRP